MKGDYDRISLKDVELNINYLLIISTSAGLWAYNIGDTIKFTSKEPYKIIVTGRIKHFLSAFGEHVISEEVEKAMKIATTNYAPWMELRIASPRINKAIYVFGDRILTDKISNSEGEEKTKYILDLLKLWEERRTVFPNITPQGAYLAKASQLKYDILWR